MPEFLELVTPQEALNKLFSAVNPQIIPEKINTEDALGRVTAEDIYSRQDLPEFRRSTVDGYAVQAKDTQGASESLPAYLYLAGELEMGRAAKDKLDHRSCYLIHTGGMLPPGADAVVMLEDSQQLESGEIEIYRSVAPNENIIEVGEDISSGDLVISRGTRLRPAEIGGLMALGITTLLVAKKPHIGIISSGDEVVPPSQQTKPGQVRDINSYTLGALLNNLGAMAVHYGIIPDNREKMLQAMELCLRECDHMIVTAGSSASSRDLTSEIMSTLGNPGVLVHGVSVKPGKPTIFAVAGDQVMIGLPGNPVSALVIAMTLVSPIIEAYLGVYQQRPQPELQARLTAPLSSQAGREDWVPVKLTKSPSGDYQAEPIFGRSNLIFLLARADGLLHIPSSSTGYEVDSLVSVRTF
jgi:molybdopterin molybdotransferase